MNVPRTRFPGMSSEVKAAIEEGRALLLRVRAGGPEAERFLLQVGSEEVFLNADGRAVPSVPVLTELLAVDDVVSFEK